MRLRIFLPECSSSENFQSKEVIRDAEVHQSHAHVSADTGSDKGAATLLRAGALVKTGSAMNGFK